MTAVWQSSLYRTG